MELICERKSVVAQSSKVSMEPDKFIGSDTRYRTVSGEFSPRIHMDSAASCLMYAPSFKAAKEYLQHYSNTHSETHFSAAISTEVYAWSHKKALEFVSASADEYASIFLGSGSTAAINRTASIFKSIRPEKKMVLISLMEHHSNDLPHRVAHADYIHFPCELRDGELGQVCLNSLKTLLEEHEGNVNYIAVTGASNVTGIVNPIYDIAELAHEFGALILVDASQLIAHRQVVMSDDGSDLRSIDALCFSGHKLYSPGSPGVLIIKKSLAMLASPTEVGGGMVDAVFTNDFVINSEFPDREEAGTPNIFGAVVLGGTLHSLMNFGFENIQRHEQELVNFLLTSMKNIEEIKVYGMTDIDRTATISFNIADLDHELTALILNDYFNIAVRNQCFCAHPYVREMIIKDLWELDPDLLVEEIEAKKGMVRVSLALYNTLQDAHLLIYAISEIIKNKDEYCAQYKLNSKGRYTHKTFIASQQFNIEKILREESKA